MNYWLQKPPQSITWEVSFTMEQPCMKREQSRSHIPCMYSVLLYSLLLLPNLIKFVLHHHISIYFTAILTIVMTQTCVTIFKNIIYIIKSYLGMCDYEQGSQFHQLSIQKSVGYCPLYAMVCVCSTNIPADGVYSKQN